MYAPFTSWHFSLTFIFQLLAKDPTTVFSQSLEEEFAELPHSIFLLSLGPIQDIPLEHQFCCRLSWSLYSADFEG